MCTVVSFCSFHSCFCCCFCFCRLVSLTRVDEGGTCWLGSTASTCRLHFKSRSLLSLLSQVQLLSVSEVCGGVPVCVCACVYAGKVCLQVLLKSSCTAHCCAHVDSWLVCLNEYKCNYLCECGCMFLCMCVCVWKGSLASLPQFQLPRIWIGNVQCA